MNQEPPTSPDQLPVRDAPIALPGNPVLGIIAGLAGVLVGAAAAATLEYATQSQGYTFFIINGLLSGYCVAWPMQKFGGFRSPIAGAIGAILGIIAAFLAVMLWMRFGVGKTFERLFSPAEREATLNTLKSIPQLINYAAAAFIGYTASWTRSS